MKLYKKYSNKIIFYPFRHEYTSIGIILSICTLLIFIPIIIDTEEKGMHVDSIYIMGLILLSLILLSFFLFLSSITQVIINTEDRKIFKRNLLGEKYLASLDDIGDIRLTKALTPIVCSYVYELTYKNNKYKDGIHLTPKLRKKSKSLRKLRETILNEVELLLKDNNTTSYGKEANRRIHLFVEERPDYYVYTPPFLGRFFIGVLSIVCLTVFIYLIVNEEIFSPYYIILLLASILFGAFVRSATNKIIIDRNNNILEIQSLAKPLKINFSDIRKILINYRAGSPFAQYDSNQGSVEIIIMHYNSKRNRLYNFEIYSSSKRNNKFAQYANDLEILLNRTIEI